MSDTLDPINQEVDKLLESPMTARIIKAALTWFLGAHNNPVLRRFSSVVNAALIWIAVHMGATQGTDTTAVVQHITAWILGSGSTIAWLLHLVYDRIQPRLEAWIDRVLPPVKKG